MVINRKVAEIHTEYSGTITLDVCEWEGLLWIRHTDSDGETHEIGIDLDHADEVLNEGLRLVKG